VPLHAPGRDRAGQPLQGAHRHPAQADGLRHQGLQEIYRGGGALRAPGGAVPCGAPQPLPGPGRHRGRGEGRAHAGDARAGLLGARGGNRHLKRPRLCPRDLVIGCAETLKGVAAYRLKLYACVVDQDAEAKLYITRQGNISSMAM